MAGAVALLASTVDETKRWNIINPASIKQALIQSATRLDLANIFEQAISLFTTLVYLFLYAPRKCILMGGAGVW